MTGVQTCALPIFWPTKRATDTNYKRMLERAMTPERTRAVRLGVAGQNLFDIAFAVELRAARGGK